MICRNHRIEKESPLEIDNLMSSRSRGSVAYGGITAEKRSICPLHASENVTIWRRINITVSLLTISAILQYEIEVVFHHHLALWTRMYRFLSSNVWRDFFEAYSYQAPASTAASSGRYRWKSSSRIISWHHCWQPCRIVDNDQRQQLLSSSCTLQCFDALVLSRSCLVSSLSMMAVICNYAWAP